METVASAPNIPAVKRAGLPVDLDRLASEGDSWLKPEDRYALKTWGVCAQVQPGVFMIRCRVAGGRLTPDQARGLAGLADAYGHSWLHLSTRQNVELHHVRAEDVPTVLAGVRALGLTTRSACGHTMRNVMSCPDAGVGLDEPFDCGPDARRVSDAILARSAELNCQLPSRINIAFGGCPVCAGHARLNDAGFESVVVDGQPGYRLWTAGSLGVAPFLAIKTVDFVDRCDAVAAAEALVDVFVNHGDLDNPKKGRLKYVVEAMGQGAYLSAFEQAYAAARERHARAAISPMPVEVLSAPQIDAVLRHVPPGGWGSGVRPQRTAGRALVTVNVPLGDLVSDDFRALAQVARLGDGHLYTTRNQNVTFRDVPLGRLPELRSDLSLRQLRLEGADSATDVRACTGSAVCSLAISAAPADGATLNGSAALARNTGLRIHVSGCPNACAQHQVGDIGLSGAKVRIGGKTRIGYHVWLGADLEVGRLAEVAGRVAEDAVAQVVDAIIGLWEALRLPAEPLSATVLRIGLVGFSAQLRSLTDGFEPGSEDLPDDVTLGSPEVGAPAVAVASA
jgi:sulfite reductase beta subunit-like hemoprotein